MRRRGSSLVAVLLLSSLLGMAGLLTLDYANQARQRVAVARYQVQAEAMARSGLRYAEAMIAHGRWRETTVFDSPALGHGERFHVSARRAAGGWQVESVGEVGAVTARLAERL